LKYKHLFHMVLGYKRVCDIMEVDIMEFRVPQFFCCLTTGAAKIALFHLYECQKVVSTWDIYKCS
jgi:hypothetical protein